MKEANYTDRLEAYLRASMTEGERDAFERELEASPELLRQAELHRAAVKAALPPQAARALDLLSEQALRAQFRTWEKEIQPASQSDTDPLPESVLRGKPVLPPKPAPVVPIWTRLPRRWAAAASVLLLFCAGGFAFVQHRAHTGEGLVRQFREAPSACAASKSAKAPDAAPNGDPCAAFDQADYAAAARLLEAVPARSEEQEFLLASSRLFNGEYAAAESSFQKMLANPGTRFREEAEWGLLMAWLAQDKLDGGYDARLEKIAGEERHSFHEDAVRLQKKLESFWRF